MTWVRKKKHSRITGYKFTAHKLKIYRIFSKLQELFQDYRTNTRLVCTHLNESKHGNENLNFENFGLSSAPDTRCVEIEGRNAQGSVFILA